MPKRPASPVTEQIPDITPPPFPDPSAAVEEAQAATEAFLLAEARAFLEPIAQGTPAQAALYRAKGQSDRARRLIGAFEKVNRSLYDAAGGETILYEQARSFVDAIHDWPAAADNAERAYAKLSTLTGKECERPEAWRVNRIWSPEVDKLQRAFHAVKSSESDLEAQLSRAEELVRRVCNQAIAGLMRTRPPLTRPNPSAS